MHICAELPNKCSIKLKYSSITKFIFNSFAMSGTWVMYVSIKIYNKQVKICCAKTFTFFKNTAKGPFTIFSIFTSVQSVLFLHTPSSFPKAYYIKVDCLNLLHVQIQ